MQIYKQDNVESIPTYLESEITIQVKNSRIPKYISKIILNSVPTTKSFSEMSESITYN